MSRKNLREAERQSLVEIASQQLFAADGESQEARDYLVGKRKFKVETLKEFSIGYVPSHIKNDDGNLVFAAFIESRQVHHLQVLADRFFVA